MFDASDDNAPVIPRIPAPRTPVETMPHPPGRRPGPAVPPPAPPSEK